MSRNAPVASGRMEDTTTHSRGDHETFLPRLSYLAPASGTAGHRRLPAPIDEPGTLRLWAPGDRTCTPAQNRPLLADTGQTQECPAASRTLPTEPACGARGLVSGSVGSVR